MIPMLEQALKSIPDVKVNMLINALELEGWELEAAWDDFKFGMEYKDVFVRISSASDIFNNITPMVQVSTS